MTATIRIRTKRIDADTTAVMRPIDGWGRRHVAGWVHESRNDFTGEHLFTGQRAGGCNPHRNQRIFTDMNAAVQWVYAPWKDRP